MKCGKCGTDAESVASVKACYAGQVEPCGDLVPDGYDECGTLQTKECGAHATFTRRGHSCEAGHEYVSMEARYNEGWDYAEDEQEAAMLAQAGVEGRVVDSGWALQL